MTEAVRLVIWDMDETFWRGTLTEGGVTWRADTQNIVVELARRGIMSSICSKNDFESVRTILSEKGAWDYFIFPSIDWTPKGPRIQRLIETVQLRAESVMLIDDNHLNLEEARFFSPGLQVAADTIIPSLLGDPFFRGKDDSGLSRLKQYKVLETRKADEERVRASSGGDNVDFLRSSDIRVRIEHDVEAHLDRAIELINRTNQLNFTKRRLPENVEPARRRLRREISRFDTQAGLIEVSDRYGNYGLCGYFQISTQRDVARLHQFCFSCRILDMGIEAWLYQRLGRPTLEICGEVLSDPVSHPAVDWIGLRASVGTENTREAGTAEHMLGSVAARGGCVLWPVAHYFRVSSTSVIGEFNTVRDGKLIMLDHSLCLRNAILGVSEDQIAALAPLGYIAEDFHPQFFDHSGERPIWILSNWADLARKVFRHNKTGIAIPYQPPRTDAEMAIHETVRPYLEAEFTPAFYDANEVKETLGLVISKIPRHGLLFLLQIPEVERQPGGEAKGNRQRQALNRWCAEAAAGHDNVRLVQVSDFIDDDTEFLNEKMTHFDRKVYYRLYLHMLSQATADSG